MKKYRLLLALGIVFFHLTALATPANTLIMLLATLRTMTADFTQIITDSNSKTIQRSTGNMALFRPGKFRWEQTIPVKQLIIVNGNRLWIYEPDLEQVTIRTLSSELGKTPALLLSDPNHTLENAYNVELVSGKKDPVQWFLLTPKNPDNMFASIKLGFGYFQIQGMVLQDHLGHTTTISFSNIVSDVVIPTSLFTFKPPRHVDVIDES